MAISHRQYVGENVCPGSKDRRRAVSRKRDIPNDGGRHTVVRSHNTVFERYERSGFPFLRLR
jgi:hypothetical protein